MSRVQVVFMSEEEVRKRGPELPAMDIQIGDQVLCWVSRNEFTPPSPLPGFLVGVHVDIDTLTFDVAFPIAGTGIYTVSRGLLTRLTRPDEDYEGNKVNEQSIAEAMRPLVQRPRLQVIVNKDSQLAEDEAAAQQQPTRHNPLLLDPASYYPDSGPLPAPPAAPARRVTVMYLCTDSDWSRFVLGMPEGSICIQEMVHSVSYVGMNEAIFDTQRFEAMERQAVEQSWDDTPRQWRIVLGHSV